MLKWARRIFVFLLLGAILNVAVAWGCVLCADNRTRDGGVFAQLELSVSTVVSTQSFGVRNLASRNEVPVCTAFLSEAEAAGEERNQRWRSEGPSTLTRAGWPLLALEGWELHPGFPSERAWLYDRKENLRWGWTWESGVRVPGGPPMLPLKPRLLPFFANTAFYGMLAWMLSTAIASVRRGFRTRRGLCPACGYPRGTSPVCTECGEALAGWASGP